MLSGSLPFRKFIRASEQSNSALNIIKILDAKTDPTTGRQIMMRLRETCRDQLVPNTLRKWHIYKIVTVNVTDLSPPEAVLRAAEAVRVSGHAWPTHCAVVDLFACFHGCTPFFNPKFTPVQATFYSSAFVAAALPH